MQLAYTACWPALHFPLHEAQVTVSLHCICRYAGCGAACSGFLPTGYRFAFANPRGSQSTAGPSAWACIVSAGCILCHNYNFHPMPPARGCHTVKVWQLNQHPQHNMLKHNTAIALWKCLVLTAQSFPADAPTANSICNTLPVCTASFCTARQPISSNTPMTQAIHGLSHRS